MRYDDMIIVKNYDKNANRNWMVAETKEIIQIGRRERRFGNQMCNDIHVKTESIVFIIM